MAVILKAENIFLKFGKRAILENVNFEVDEGSIVVITGKSGTGKTTLLGIISGLLRPQKGKMFFRGKNILWWGDFRKSHFRNKSIGFIFQFFNLLPDFTSYQNIVYPCTLSPFRRVKKNDLDKLVEYLNIGKIIHDYPETLSGGERQRVAIARAIINNPPLVLADEPTGNLDDESADDIISLFKSLKDDDKKTLIIVTHDSRIIKLADRHYHLKDAVLSEITRKVKFDKTGEIAPAVKTVKKKTSASAKVVKKPGTSDKKKKTKVKTPVRKK